MYANKLVVSFPCATVSTPSMRFCYSHYDTISFSSNEGVIVTYKYISLNPLLIFLAGYVQKALEINGHLLESQTELRVSL